jgi:lipopolysaccharide transport system ATP-binding protein
VDFAGVHKFMDTPVKRYSSGMYVRLAFAVAAHLEPEILVVDEVLAVGDATFQKKCIGKMNTIAKGGRTVLFVSHNLPAVSSLCDTAIWMDAGQLREHGPTSPVIAAYLNSSYSKQIADLQTRTDRIGDGRFKFTRVWLTDGEADSVDSLSSGKEAVFMIQYVAQQGERLRDIIAQVIIRDLYGSVLFTLSSHLTGQNFEALGGPGTLICRVPMMPLAADTYVIDLWSSVNGEPSD